MKLLLLRRFDGEVVVSIKDKLFKQFKKSKLQIDKELFNTGRNRTQSLISNKNKYFFKEKLDDNIDEPKELWESLNSLGVSSKRNLDL